MPTPKPAPQESITTYVRMDRQTSDAVRELATQERRSISQQINFMLAEYIVQNTTTATEH